MQISNLYVYDLMESVIASGYPMRTDAQQKAATEKDIKRVLNLVKASNGNGAHGQWMTGARVAFDLKCSNKMWVEAERYRFLEFVSSQSTMHRIAKFDIGSQCNEYVSAAIIEEVNKLKDAYLTDPTPENYLKLLYNIPSGFELTARVTTNYRCLLNIYIQRKDHRLPEWREFCDYMLENLPMFKDIVAAYESGKINESQTL